MTNSVSVLTHGSTNVTTQAFSPHHIAGLEAWYRPEAITNIAAGLAVTNWPDSSGKHRTMQVNSAQSTSAWGFYSNNVLNSRAMVRFYGTNGYKAAFPYFMQETIIVVYTGRTGANGSMVSHWTGANMTSGDVLTREATYFPDSSSASISLSKNLNTNELFIARNNYTGDAADTFINGTAAGSMTPTPITSADEIISVSKARDYFIGIGPAQVEPYDGYVGEVLIYSRWLSDEEIDLLEEYLSQSAQWGTAVLQ
jgi:hypothetical protein